ncbi:MAG: FAD-binding oxidoreductase [Gammaproteobacteria bacterium]
MSTIDPPSAVHTGSYYAATARAIPDYPALAGDADCDVCVIGAGITGLSAALHLAERGYRVTVLERARVGWGASGRNGGQANVGYSCDIQVLSAMLGLDAARRLWALSVEAVDLLKTLIARHRIACDLKPGILYAALKPRQQRALEEESRLLERDYGYHRLELLTGERLRAALNSPRYCAGLYFADGAHLHPLNYTLGLAEAARAAGALIHEQTTALRVEHGPNPIVHGAHGQVRCHTVLLCANAYLGDLEPRLWRKIMPVGTYIVATEPLGAARAHDLIGSDAAVADTNFVLDYYRLSPDHRLLFGGRVSYSGFTPPRLPDALRGKMLRVFPQLGDVRIDFAWGGFVDLTMNRAPHFGKLADNVYFAQGFCGHGLALTGLAGKLMAEAIAGDAERFDLFGRIRHRDFPGGPLRAPLLALAMLYYRLRDWL